MTRSQLFAAAGLTAALAADAVLILVDTYRGVSCTSVGSAESSCTSTSASLVEMNGERVLLLLAVPTLLAALVLLLVSPVALAHVPGVLAWVVASFFLACCIAAGFSIGLFYLPAAALCFAAVATRPQASTSAS